MRMADWLKLLIFVHRLCFVFPDQVSRLQRVHTYTKHCKASEYTEDEAKKQCTNENKHLAIIRTDSDLYDAVTGNCVKEPCGQNSYWIGLKYDKSQGYFYRYDNSTDIIPFNTAHKMEKCGEEDKYKCIHLHIKEGNSVEKIHCEECSKGKKCVICQNNSAPTTTSKTQTVQTYTRYCSDSKYKIDTAENECKSKAKDLATFETDSDLYYAATATCTGNKCSEKKYLLGIKYSTGLKTFYRLDKKTGSKIPIYTAHLTNGCDQDEECAYFENDIITGKQEYIKEIKCEPCPDIEQYCVVCKNQSSSETPSSTWSTAKEVYSTTSAHKSPVRSYQLPISAMHLTTVPPSDSSITPSTRTFSSLPITKDISKTTAVSIKSNSILEPTTTSLLLPGHNLTSTTKRFSSKLQSTMHFSSTPGLDANPTTFSLRDIPILHTTTISRSAPGDGISTAFITNIPSSVWKVYQSPSSRSSELEKNKCRNDMNKSIGKIKDMFEVKNNDFSYLPILRKWEDFKLNCSTSIREELEVSREPLGVAMFSMFVGEDEVKNKSAFKFARSEFELELPRNLLQEKGRRILVILSNKTAHNMTTKYHRAIDGQYGNHALVTPLMTLTLQPRLPPLDGNITLTIHHLTKLSGVAQFVFWDFSIKSEFGGSWSSRGCTIKKSTGMKTVASCNHLTTFAVLMQVDGQRYPVSQEDEVALDIIFYIGCALSLTAEMVALFVYFVLFDFGRKGSTNIRVRINLFISLMAAQVIFITGIESTENKGVCIFVSALLHYLYLVAMDWMLVEGLVLYTKIVQVFNISTKMAFFYIFAWGFPAVMVSLSLITAWVSKGGIDDNYVQKNICWLSTSNNLIWTFAAAVAVIISLNIIILAFIVREISNLKNVGNEEMNKFRQAIRASILLTPVLGVTWIFGLLAVGGAGLAFTYIFNILNSLQGFLIFIFQVLMSKEVRAAYQMKKQRWLLNNKVQQSQTSKRLSTVDIAGPRTDDISLGQMYANFEAKDCKC